MKQTCFMNSLFSFVESTIREDSGVKGAILVDSIILREGYLDYPNGKQNIVFNTIDDKGFVNNLSGVLVFREHPNEMVTSENYASLAGKSIGTIMNATYKDYCGKEVVWGTLRITDPKAIEDIRNRRLRGGSLGYFANIEGDTQTDFKPNHFCLTDSPRDSGVVLFNSKNLNQIQGDTMDLKENEIIVSKSVLNSFLGQIETKITDTKVKAILNSKTSDVDKLNFLESICCVNDIFNSVKEEVKDQPKQNSNEDDLKLVINSLEQKIDELQKSIAMKNSDDEPKEDEPKDNGDEPKGDESKGDEEPKGNGEESQETKENSDDDSKEEEVSKDNSDCEDSKDTKVENSDVAKLGVKAVVNSDSKDANFAKLLSLI